MITVAYTEDGVTSTEQYVGDPRKKNVLLLGDSIRCGYCGTVREKLADIANVYYPRENCRNTQYTLTSLHGWSGLCSAGEVDAVHFNCGHWDIAHWEGEEISLTPLNAYVQNLARIVNRLRKAFPSAAVYFATTTPMNPSGIIGRNPRTTDEIRTYNAAAKAAVSTLGVEINDLFSFTEGFGTELYRDYCHYTADGFAKIGVEVAEFIGKRL